VDLLEVPPTPMPLRDAVYLIACVHEKSGFKARKAESQLATGLSVEKSSKASGIPQSAGDTARRVAHSAVFSLWREEIRERLWIWHTNSSDIIPTRCSFQMRICAECHQLNRILIQRDIPKRVVEHRRAIERLR
jgi:hypothetical protein